MDKASKSYHPPESTFGMQLPAIGMPINGANQLGNQTYASQESAAVDHGASQLGGSVSYLTPIPMGEPATYLAPVPTEPEYAAVDYGATQL